MLDKVFCGGIDTNKISSDDILVIEANNSQSVYVKAQVLEKIYIKDDKPHTVLQFSDACLTTLCNDNADFNKSLMIISMSFQDTKTLDPLTIPSGNQAVSICGAPKQEIFQQAQRAVDYNNTNDRGFFPAAIKPTSAVIPLRSNIRTYGPYATPNFELCGGTNVEQDVDLAPWVFGSVAAMNQAGNIRVNNVPINPLAISETGSYTHTGLPSLLLGANPGLPNLTGINISFGGAGITTSYSFQTYTPKFGSLSRNYLERIKTIQKNKQKAAQIARNQAIDINKINRRLQVINQRNNAANNNLARPPNEAETVQRVIVGEIYDFQNINDDLGQRTVVGATTLSKTIAELRYDYSKKAYMSIDGFFGPVSVSGDGGLPRYAAFEPSCHKASPLCPQPPFVVDSGNEQEDPFASGLDQHNLDITQTYLNPLTNPGEHHHDGDCAGHVVDLVGRGTGIPENGMIMNFYDETQEEERYADDYRFLGLRGPVVLHAWGYDTQGKPIPNAADDVEATKQGQFKKTDLQDKFLKDWLHKPASWPVAPLDLRFDRDRGVWVSPPSYKIIVAKLKENLKPYGSAKAQIINEKDGTEYGPKLYDKDGVEIKATDDEEGKAIIKVVDRLGKEYAQDSILYVYYDSYKCEYLILQGDGNDQIVRFKLVDICKFHSGVDQNLILTPPDYNDTFTDEFGYGDKYYDSMVGSDSYALRLNCNRQPIDKKGNLLSIDDLQDINKVKENLIIVRDVCGHWGPSFNRLYLDLTAEEDQEQEKLGRKKSVARWLARAAEGYGVRLGDPVPSGQSETLCANNLPCEILYTNEDNETVSVSGIPYDILYLESYARVITGCLKQHLYIPSGVASELYSEDAWKTDHPKGNALLKIEKFYGNAPNGNKPYYMKEQDDIFNIPLDKIEDEEDQLEIRVFDPWYNDTSPFECYSEKDSPFYDAGEGTPVTAIFNEKIKKYEIVQIGKRKSDIIRFKIIDKCDGSYPNPNYPKGDDWTNFAAYLDKWPNSHILGVRINCDGQPIDKFGNIISDNDINNEDKKEIIYINLYDTSGSHGPAFAAYSNFESWKNQAFTGFAAKISTPPSGSSCSTGISSFQCSDPDADLECYDILFLDSYARFIECTLTQPLYPKGSQSFQGDEYKNEHRDGNAAANELHFYGGSPNSQEPKFYKNNGDEVPFRVFDPFIDEDREKNPFAKLQAGDRVLAVFDESKKKYIIYNSLKYKDKSIIKFALVDNKDIRDRSVRAVRVDSEGYPIDDNDNKLDANNFDDNIITVYDPFANRLPDIPGQPSAFGPALGGKTFNEHINGIDVDDGNENIIEKIGPFIGFATVVSSSGVSPSGSGIYEMFQLERYADLVVGKIGTIEPINGFYHAARYPTQGGFVNGVAPLTRKPIPNGFNLRVNYHIPQEHDNYIIGDFKESGAGGQGLYDNIDGCLFIAKLDNYASDFRNNEEKLCYTIVEAQHVAKRGTTVLKDQENAADLLNNQFVGEDDQNALVSSTYYGGFQWSKTASPTHYKGISIYNRQDWSGKPYLAKNSIVYTNITGINNGNPIYTVAHGHQIAHIMEKSAYDGKTGCNPTPEQKKVNANTFLYQGNSSIQNLGGQEPGFTLNNQKWMTYQNSFMLGFLDENTGPNIVNNNNLYRIVYAREAPVIIIGTAKEKFTSDNLTDGISIEGLYASCPGLSSNPIPNFLNEKVQNPLGFGAQKDDLVVLQRYYTSNCGDSGPYTYIVIGTGKPAGTC